MEWPVAVTNQQSDTEPLLNDASNSFTPPEERRDINTNSCRQTESDSKVHTEQPLESLSNEEEKSFNHEITTTKNDRSNKTFNILILKKKSWIVLF